MDAYTVLFVIMWVLSLLFALSSGIAIGVSMISRHLQNSAEQLKEAVIGIFKGVK